jgi:hypothetical protein
VAPAPTFFILWRELYYTIKEYNTPAYGEAYPCHAPRHPSLSSFGCCLSNYHIIKLSNSHIAFPLSPVTRHPSPPLLFTSFKPLAFVQTKHSCSEQMDNVIAREIPLKSIILISRGNLPLCISVSPNAALLNTKDNMEDCRSLCSVYILIEKASQ